jgi:hypothetical protein
MWNRDHLQDDGGTDQTERDEAHWRAWPQEESEQKNANRSSAQADTDNR